MVQHGKRPYNRPPQNPCHGDCVNCIGCSGLPGRAAALVKLGKVEEAAGYMQELLGIDKSEAVSMVYAWAAVHKITWS